ncbi:uncharacterized protein LY89DRAFT_738487 [Mollisia scopiformis]|uniref:Uncharacterized protein n=1 Tax=Mollisia scopiformis TaxID=149040 RepID=A0A194WW81_MOLSC|nr:uncharacterized protein LY89DRAFT_738487 [Mollisia scopiformis]KUJ11842.1 hypothetical protein LY89DRAFT_738487 [Mollisia scopiformis]
MFFKTFAILAFGALSTAASLPHRRSSESDVVLYCYGSTSNGGPIFYADGLAYFGMSANTLDAGVSTNISFTLDPDDTTTAWTIQPNTTTNPNVSFNETLDMYIVPTDGSFTQVGFASSNSSSLPTGAVTTGFSFFGTNVAYVESSSNYDMMFWGNATTTDGIFALYWNDGSDDAPNGSFAVTVKTTPPVSI